MDLILVVAILSGQKAHGLFLPREKSPSVAACPLHFLRDRAGEAGSFVWMPARRFYSLARDRTFARRASP
jgi:hypothetical protein